MATLDHARPTRVRHIVLWLTVAAYMITYMDRVVISSAIPKIQEEFGEPFHACRPLHDPALQGAPLNAVYLAIGHHKQAGPWQAIADTVGRGFDGKRNLRLRSPA